MADSGIVYGSIANLIGGVSQQPWNVRMPSQCEKMVNCHATITEFMKRRPALSQVAPISVPDNDGNFVGVSIDKGTDEKYIALFGKSGVKVFDTEGNEKTVNVTSSGVNYLKNVTDAKTQLRFCNIKDYTFCVNTKQKVLESNDSVPARAKECIVFVKQASYQTKYSVILDGNTYSYETPSSTYEEGTDPPQISANQILNNIAADIRAGKTVVLRDDVSLVGSIYLNDVRFEGLNRKLSISRGYDYEEQTSKGITIGSSSSTRDIYYDADRQRALIYVGDGTNQWWLISGVTKNNLTAGSRLDPKIEKVFDNLTGDKPVGHSEAYVLVEGDNHTVINTSSGTPVTIQSNYNVTVAAATMHITSKNGTEFTLEVKDSRSNTHIDSWKYECTSIEDLPTTAPKDYILKISGDNGTDIDDYYVKFIPTSGKTMTSGIWKECALPEAHMGFDNATMPHALIRNADGSFTFGQVPWDKRKVGDSLTNGSPSFAGSTISNILFYRNRLCFLSADNIIMSETNEFFNFFLTTMLTAVDNDPIDVAASGVKDTNLYGYSLFSGGLIVFSTKAQFLVEHDTVLSNSTISLSPVTEFESTNEAEPKSSGKTIFFAVNRGKFVGIREYLAFDQNNKESNDASDITAAVPSYIEGPVIDLQCSSNEDTLLVRTSSDLRKIYVYKYFWNGNEKAQSSWYEWDMSGDVYTSLFFGTSVYCVMHYDDGWFLESLSFEPSHKDEGEDFEFCLDRKLTESSCVIGNYCPLTLTTDITIPYDDPRVTIVTRSGGDLKAGSILPEMKREGNVVTVKAKITADTRFFVGIPYESLYTFTTFGIRQQNNSAVTTGRLQLRGMALNLNKTGYVDITVKPKGKLESVYRFTGKRIGEDSAAIGDIPIYSGQVKFPILSVNVNASITAKSDSHLPFALVNADWEGYYTSRSTRM